MLAIKHVNMINNKVDDAEIKHKVAVITPKLISFSLLYQNIP